MLLVHVSTRHLLSVRRKVVLQKELVPALDNGFIFDAEVHTRTNKTQTIKV